MPAKWTDKQKEAKTVELFKLYTLENKSLREISKILGFAESTVYTQLLKCRITINRSAKSGFNKQRIVQTPPYSAHLAEFIGIMLGDGSLKYYQVAVTLGTKELAYCNFVAVLMKAIFKISPKIQVTKDGYTQVYFGARNIVKWLLEMGLAYNKVARQVQIPSWCFRNHLFIKATLRGLIDTDGSVYKLKHGAQISFTNRSIPLLKGAQSMLKYLGYSPSRISCFKIYLTRKPDLLRYASEIGFHNPKHLERFHKFLKTK